MRSKYQFPGGDIGDPRGAALVAIEGARSGWRRSGCRGARQENSGAEREVATSRSDAVEECSRSRARDGGAGAQSDRGGKIKDRRGVEMVARDDKKRS